MKNKIWLWIGLGAVVIIVIIVIASKSMADKAEKIQEDAEQASDDSALSSGGISKEQHKARRECRRQCRTLCRASKGWLFGGRSKCRRNCKADCLKKGTSYIQQNY